MKKLFASLLLSAALGACAPRHASFVKVDNVALGRVVVYRNGVAFYERRATVTGGMLTVTVPRDRVDDFLKSLTVVDAISGKALPISIPRQQSGDSTNLEMHLQLPPEASKGKADVVLTYVTEAPSWKPSYRVAVGNNGKVMLEGWAIVDNTSGEDWNGVMVGVGSSSALSFKYDLWSVRQVQRETLQTDEKFAVAPPTGISPYGGAKPAADGDAMLAELDDSEIRRPDGHPEAQKKKELAFAGEEAGLSDESVSGSIASVAPSGGPSRQDPRPPPTNAKSSSHRRPPTTTTAGTPAQEASDARVAAGDQKMRAISQSLVHSDKTIVIDAYADATKADAQRKVNDRANIVKNQLIDAGVAPARIKIVTHVDAGAAERVRLIAQAAPAQQKLDGKQDAAAEPVGESHFENPMPMTVAKDSSAMVSMVRHETEGEVVYLYDAESERGNDKFAFRAVRFKNPTDSTLETGPVTVYGSERFIGEGLTEPIPPKSTAVVPYALYRQIVIEKSETENDQLSRLVTLQRGVLTAEVQHIRHDKMTITNRLNQVAKVYIRHTVNKGWKVLEAPPAFERTGDAHLFEVDLKPNEVKEVVISEATPMEKTLDLSADVTVDMMKVYVQSAAATPEL
ncbi:MAG TPA: hypothetical protein VGC41_29735, partial [Kofleriaceae bacterium]